MLITFEQGFKYVGPFLGKNGYAECDIIDPTARLHFCVLLEQYVNRNGTEKKFCIRTCDNCFTYPRDMAKAIKVKINGKVETVGSFWYEFQDGVDCSEDNWGLAGIVQEPNTFPTVFDVPKTGAYVLAELSKFCKNKEGLTTIIQGLDAESNEEVYTQHKGELIKGEVLTLEPGVSKRTNKRFSKITNIIKDETLDWVQYRYQSNKSDTPRFLSKMAPRETVGEFRRGKLTGHEMDDGCCYELTILGRVLVRSDYHNNDVIPVSSLEALRQTAEAMQAAANNNIPVLTAKLQLADRIMDDKHEYDRVGEEPFNFVRVLSAGSIRHIR